MNTGTGDLSICVITATTGQRSLERCLASVQAQTQTNIKHCVVIDGPQHADRARRIIEDISHPRNPINVFQLPEPTGQNDWICHRIYGAMPFLVNESWISFLDEDNWYDDDHLQSLMAAVTASQAQWGFSLRKICDEAGTMVCLDQCESLGSLHPVFERDDVRLIDTNCYLLRRDIAIKLCPIWNRPRHPQGVHKPDFVLCATLLQTNIPSAATLRHSVNYVVAPKSKSVPIQYFLHGNALMRRRYPGGLPWELPAPP